MKQSNRRTFRYGLCLLFAVILLTTDVSPVFGSSGRTIEGETIRGIVAGHIKKILAVPDESVRIEFSSAVPDIAVPEGAITWRIYHNRNEDFLGYTTVSVRFYRDNIFLKEEAVRTKVEVLKDVVVASRYLPRNTVIGYDDVKVVKKWRDRAYPNQVSDITGVIGKTVNGRVKANYEIGRNILRQSVAVQRGALVRIVFNSGPLTVSTIGETEENGDLGSMIRVKNIRSNKVIYARVESDSLVRVDY
ncbi:MAG: flagellar basal body P-ring formation protein FlgA [Deltaproteobacteria bacterium]|nr:flagellar basal body P-ring formation protein FlgA [Deltaproteobacteria bacterium]